MPVSTDQLRPRVVNCANGEGVKVLDVSSDDAKVVNPGCSRGAKLMIAETSASACKTHFRFPAPNGYIDPRTIKYCRLKMAVLNVPDIPATGCRNVWRPNSVRTLAGMPKILLAFRKSITWVPWGLPSGSVLKSRWCPNPPLFLHQGWRYSRPVHSRLGGSKSVVPSVIFHQPLA